MKVMRMLFKIFSIGSILFFLGLYIIFFSIKSEGKYGADLSIYQHTAFSLSMVSFLSNILCILMSFIFLIKKIPFERFYLILFLIGLISYIWIIYVDTDGIFYWLLD